MAQLLSNVYQRFFDSNGVPLAGGKLYSYNAGTSVPLATYTDQTAATPNPNPVVLDSAGGAQIWITNAGYKLALTDSLGNAQWTVDQVYLIEPGAVGSSQIANGAVGTAQLAAQAVTTSKIQTGAITTALLAASAVVSGNIANGAVTLACLDPNLDLSQLASSVEVVFKRTDDLSGGRIIPIPQFPWTNPAQQTNPTTLPAGQGNSAKFSPDGRFLAVAHLTTPFVTIYERAGLNFNKLANPTTLPAGGAQGLAWSPNGDFLVVSHGTTPFFTIYQRQGINFTKLSNPASLPTGTGLGVAFSPNGEFLAVSSIGGFNLYNIKGTTFTDITSGSGISGNNGFQGSVAWSNDSQYLALSNGSGSGNLFNCYQRTGVTFTGMTIGTQPATLPTCLAFTHDGLNLIGGFSTSPAFAFSYAISGSTLTGPTNPFPVGSPPTGIVGGISISPNNQLIAITTSVAPFLQIYTGTIAGGFTLNANPATVMTQQCNGVSWSPTNEFLALAVQGTPFVNIYLTASLMSAKGLFYCRNFFDV
jgi:WD40 repeat protein